MRKANILSGCCTLLLLCGCFLFSLQSQGQSLTFWEISSTEGNAGDTVSLALISRTPINLRGFGLSMVSSSEDLQPLSAQSGGLPVFQQGSSYVLTEESIDFSWFSGSFMPIAFQAGDTILQVDYLVLSDSPFREVAFEFSPVLPEIIGSTASPRPFFLLSGGIASTSTDAWPAVEGIAVAPAKCSPSQSGSFELLLPSGPDYELNWASGSGQPLGSGLSIDGLAPGSYRFRLSKDGGPERRALVSMPRESLWINALTAQNADCNQANGRIEATWGTNAETPSVSYLWSTGDTIPMLENLSPGTYSLTLSDSSNGCSAQASTTVGERADLYFTEQSQVVPLLCNEGNSGRISLEVGGTDAVGLSYLWENGTFGPNRFLLAPGAYTITVSNQYGCELSRTISVPRQNGLNVTADYRATLNCRIPATDIRLIPPRNGTGINYYWSDQSLGPIKADIHTASTYSVTVQDSQTGCSGTRNFTIQTTPMELDVLPSCDQGPPPHSALLWASAYDGGSIGPYTFDWSPGTLPFMSVDNHSFVYVEPGQPYQVTVTDAAGCQAVSDTLIANCLGTGSQEEARIEPTSPAEPATLGANATIRAGEITGNSADTLCLPIRVRQLNNSSFRCSFGWDSEKLALNHVAIKDDLFLNTLIYQNDYPQIGFDWRQPPGQALRPDSSIVAYELCFDWIGQGGRASVFPSPYPLSSQDITPFGGSVKVDCAGDLGLSLAELSMPSSGTAEDGRILLDFPGGRAPHQYRWEKGDSLYRAGEHAVLTQAQAGEYTIIVTDGDHCSDTLLVSLLSDDVWPGDTDTNHIVNHYDLLNIGLAYDAIGPARPDASLAWQAQPAPDWAQPTTATQANYKHIDSNGDGQIDAMDTLAIHLNWDSTYQFVPNGVEEQRVVDGIPFYVKPDTLIAGETMALPIILGEADNPAEEVYGLAFSLFYDASIVVDGSAFVDFNDSWLGELGSNAISIQRDYSVAGRIDVSMTRIDGQNQMGFGQLGQFIITIEDDILAQLLAEGYLFTIAQVRIINFAGEEQAVAPRTTEANVLSNVTVPPSLRGLRLFPNPATETAWVEFPRRVGAWLELFNAQGQLVRRHRMEVEAQQLLLQDLPAGPYWLRAINKDGQTLRRLIKH